MGVGSQIGMAKISALPFTSHGIGEISYGPLAYSLDFNMRLLQGVHGLAWLSHYGQCLGNSKRLTNGRFLNTNIFGLKS